jgi:hypothetical protein
LNAFIVELLITGILWLVGQFASLLVFWAYPLSPLLIGFRCNPTLRSIGTRG